MTFSLRVYPASAVCWNLLISTEDISRAPGLLQSLDPRVKLVSFLLFIVTVSLVHSLPVLGGIFVLVLLMSLASKVPPGFFLKRVLIFVPIFTAGNCHTGALPDCGTTAGTHRRAKSLLHSKGALSAGFLLLRVTDSLSLGVLLVLTTPWSNILVALRWIRVPSLLVDILGMTYRYMFLLLHSANSMFLARRSRVIGSFSGSENRRWLGRALATTMAKSQRLSEDVYLAMLSRGYQGEVRVLNEFSLKRRDFLWIAFSLVAIAVLFWVSRIMNVLNNVNVFEAKNLDYDYPGNIIALRQVSFTVKPGEVVALVGANGSGKSTLLKLMDGLIFPKAGELLALGRLLSEEGLKDKVFVREFRRKVGMVFQDPDVQLFSPTVWDEVIFGPLQLGISKEEVIARGQAVLELMGISHLRERPPYLLSGGEKKKVSLASVLSLQPQVLLMDEPTTGLDPSSQGKLIDFLLQWAETDKCLVFSTQDLDIVEEIATRVIVMGVEHDILADGKPEEFLSDPDFLLRANLVHEHSHRHRELIHRHPHLHEHQH